MTTMTSKPLYVYLQRPDTGVWITVGRYKLEGDTGTGLFKYAPSYVEAGHAWSIDPVNLPFLPGRDLEARRYRGLHDVLRDACPDAWGKMLLQRQHNLPANTHDSRYLMLAGNADRWGALAVGPSSKPSVAALSSPRLPLLEALSREMLAIFERRPALDARLRQRLLATPSLGGARPKTTIQDAGQYWLIKPLLPTDVTDIPLLEHAAQQWGRASGLNFALTVYHKLGDGLSVVRVLRFDRLANRRHMAVSGASLCKPSTRSSARTRRCAGVTRAWPKNSSASVRPSKTVSISLTAWYSMPWPAMMTTIHAITRSCTNRQNAAGGCRLPSMSSPIPSSRHAP